jgi:tetratricopeptide (TPR) repeat protein
MHPDRPSPHPPAHEFAGDPVADAQLDAELDAALEHGDSLTSSHLAFEQSVKFHRIEDYRNAILYGDLAIEAWQSFFHDRPSRDEPSVRFTGLRMLNASTAQHFCRGHFDIAAERIQEARRLALFSPDSSLIASTEWNAALMERWRSDYPKALEHAERALVIYRAQSDPMSVARLSQFAAQVALDCVMSARSRGATRLAASYLAKARKHLTNSRPPGDGFIADAVDDNFRLIYAVYSRLKRKNEDRAELLESVILHAHAMEYPALEGLAFHVLGDEYASREGLSGQASGCYARAFKLLLSSSAPAYAVWPLRALKQEWEYSLNSVADVLR